MSEQRESTAQDFGERLFVELPMKQRGKAVVVSFVPLVAGVVAEHIGALPSDANIAEGGVRPKTFVERATDVESVNERLVALMAAADTLPRFTLSGGDGSVRWSLLLPENQTALMLAVMEASGFRSGGTAPAARFLEDEGGAA